MLHGDPGPAITCLCILSRRPRDESSSRLNTQVGAHLEFANDFA
jgi:hypothetical protein